MIKSSEQLKLNAFKFYLELFVFPVAFIVHHIKFYHEMVSVA